MTKPLEIIYSQQSTDYIEGRAYSNPRFFTSPRANAAKVWLVGEWPEIRAAYENLNIPVEQLGADAATAQPAPVIASHPPVRQVEDPASVVIPDDWRDRGWSKPNEDGQTLRGLASSLSATPILNKEMAYACIEGELARREAHPAAED